MVEFASGSIVKALSLFKEEAENNYIKISKLNAKAFSKELNQDLSNIEQIINNIHSIIDISMPLTSINRRLVDMQKNYPQIRSINILKNDTIIYSSNLENINLVIKNLNLFPNPIFEENILKISTPWIGRDFINGDDVYTNEEKISKNETFFIPISKTILSKNSDYNVVINLNNDYFINRFLNSIDSDYVTFELIRLDGILLLSTDDSKIIGTKIKEQDLLEKTFEKNEITKVDTIDGKKYILTYTLTDNFPITLAVKFDYEKSMSNWNKKEYEFFIITIMTIIITIIVSLYLFYLYNKGKENEIILHKKQSQEQEKFKLLFEDSHFLAAVLDERGKIIDINKTALIFLNQNINEVKEKNIWDLKCWRDAEKVFFKNSFLIGPLKKDISKEIIALNSNNEEAIIDLNIYTISKNNEHNYIIIGQDITQRKNREKKLKQAYSVFSNTHDGIIITNKDTKIIDVNNAFTKITGYTKEEILGIKTSILKSSIHSKKFYENMWEKIRTAGHWEGEVTNKDKNGILYTEWLTINTIYDKNNSILNYIGVFSDITEQKNKDIKIRESEAKLKKFFHHSGVGIARVSLDGHWLEVNDKLCQILGYEKDELLKSTFQDITYYKDLDEDLTYVSKMIQKEIDSYEMEKRYIKKDNSLVWIKLTVTLILKENGEPNYFISVIQDINANKLYEKSIKQALLVFENTRDGIMITNKKNQIININPAFTKTTGYSLKEILGENPSILKSNKQDKIFYENMWKNLIENGFWVGEIINKDKNGNLYEELLSINIIRNSNNEIENYIGIFSDITIQKQQEKMLLQQARTSAVGEMIGNIAHQWRQPLSVISTASTGLKFTLEIGNKISKEDIIPTLDKINEHTQHLSKTIDDFRNFFRGDISDRKEFNLKKTLLKVEDLTIDSFNNNFIIVKKDIKDDIYIEGNENLLIQALINIYNNAIDALKEQNQNAKLFYVSLEKNENRISILLKDNAGGIKKDLMEKIFEPYFTTKHQSVGTGLGLYMTHQIITKQFHGEINVYNEEFIYENESNREC
ncbi:PAS sensor-containing signal transduction histidine kinase [Malaciobacter pacificus]|uniref:histidine kinase n=1 Tax=Malaciobacter pacificus TaxID=1080223 RepID=A0A5C2HCY2_9BACT|nr:PAS sensor-containing signal transduction histidine kinase [Malaciobacter pacificus]